MSGPIQPSVAHVVLDQDGLPRELLKRVSRPRSHAATAFPTRGVDHNGDYWQATDGCRFYVAGGEPFPASWHLELIHQRWHQADSP